MMKGKKTYIGLAAALALSTGAVLASEPGAGAVAPTDVTVCVADSGNSDAPYSQDTIKSNQSNKVDDTEGVFLLVDGPSEWGDIVRPAMFDDFPDGVNWTDAGQAIFNNGC